MEEFSNMSVVGLFKNDSLNGTVVNEPFKKLHRAITIIVICVIFVVMLSLGCTMEISKIKAHIMKPKGVGIAVVAQFGIMPLTAFCLAKAFRLTGIHAVVVLICGCCPGGHLSNVMSLAIKGDMNLSIVMTTCSTVLALGMMPLLLLLYCQGFSNIREAIPYRDIVRSLFSILVPCGIGILINHYRPQYSNVITKAGLSISAMAMFVTIVLVLHDAGAMILAIVAPPMLAIAFLLPLIGFILGYMFSFAFRLTHAERRTVMMETGCQNGQLAVAIIRLGFPPAAVGTLFLFPAVMGFTQAVETGLLVLMFRAHQCWQQRKTKEGYQPGSPAVQ